MRQTNEMGTVDAPVEVVYEYFADLRHIPDYDPQAKSTRPTSDDGWLGSTFATDFVPVGLGRASSFRSSSVPLARPIPATPWDPPLAAAMSALGVTVYEEQLRTTLIDAMSA